MTYLTLALQGVAGLLVAATALPLIETNLGFVRSLDFPRLQIAVALAACLVGLLLVSRDLPSLILAIAMAAALVTQVRYIQPFTPLAATQAKSADSCEPGARLNLLVLNVLQSNRNFGAALDLVTQRSPDLVLLLETDSGWQAAMAPLRERYPHRVEQPQDNTYGLLFYSRLPLRGPEIRFLLQDDVPSLRTRVLLPDGETATLYGLHPRPPHPGHSSAPRDAELVIVAREVAEGRGPTIVAGDLNDVAWSRTTQLFQNISGLLDPRRGRGLFATFHAQWPVMRWPLDHVFFSEHFLLGGMERLPDVGSDHFPISVSLCAAPHAPARQDKPEATAEDHHDAREAIEAVR
ncbi:endonuclease/exonuclease/phosphatase family protein [Methylobacterium sp. E-045]|uniref:endonuclease/exonuclease/phosphatase family protein n=1 Tax=Methylobacterium sp. E-045 TaxID=2836575 RepID=UPI001FBA4B5C|nr:endonuclease/exonuclease/phosphatase family protein [Methylobacterium sp. E-045]MCJ2131041.1 endonuclease/exonuclease/phosphatase family protein [Methylobacterium sp. E-045]